VDNKLSPEQVAEILQLHMRGTPQREIARQVQCSQSTVSDHIKRAAARGHFGTDPVMPGFEISGVSTQAGLDGETEREWIRQRPERIDAEGPHTPRIPAGHIIKGVSTLTDEAGRRIAQWTKTRESAGPTPEQIVEALRGAFNDDMPRNPRPPGEYSRPAGCESLLTLMPCNDWHLGMHAWGREVGQNWDLQIAEDRIEEAVRDAIHRAPPAAVCVLLGGGDILHADNNDNRTSKSGNPLDVDGRYPKVLQVAARLMVKATDYALERNEDVESRILPGNHDEYSSYALAAYLHAYYRNEPRVKVDLDPGLFWWKRWGTTMLGATHGHTVKVEDMPGIMAHRRAADWGATRHRYVHGFHLHHRRTLATEGMGCVSEIHQAPIPQDAWHHGAGFLSGRSVQAITYSDTHGEIGRARVALLDA
jgi:DNA-binding Lrp family transcriptional regulator